MLSSPPKRQSSHWGLKTDPVKSIGWPIRRAPNPLIYQSPAESRPPVAKIRTDKYILHDYRQHQASTRSDCQTKSLLLIMYPGPMFGHDCGDFELKYRKRFFLRSFLYAKQSRHAQAHTKQKRDRPSYAYFVK
jgi:hypothetical protein